MSHVQVLGVPCLRAFTRAVPASLAAFYTIDDTLSARDFQLAGDARPIHDHYLTRYRHLDPLQPGYCLQTGRQVLSLDDARALQSEARNRGYQNFLTQHDVVDVAEVFFHAHGRPVFGLSLLRRSAYGHFTHHEMATLQSLQEMMQLAVDQRPPELSHTGHAPLSPALTARETQLAELVRHGLSNKAMARELGIAPSTVKTHLDHLYRKLNVTNRTELVGRLYL
ncbi:helix-turn-helix transcriptional regulator [Kushneria pakistanensis]|uniref:Helix-turn-helix transcriptional regulator n=1 Tax=Kushneria pakistanensis TaxID=1508770 RepID=A0ABQ3FGZ2_9GAMM|nr:helix-turn-helix transcriptional regulator [Kushneria pakistanensis]GHC23119.1 helix-turn-helix transcriptional regulator [Kushneria pakistanensis]